MLYGPSSCRLVCGSDFPSGAYEAPTGALTVEIVNVKG